MANTDKKANLNFVKELILDLLRSDEVKAILKPILLDIIKELGYGEGGYIPPVETPSTTPATKGTWKKVIEFVVSLLPTIIGLFTKKKTSTTVK